MKRLLLFTAGLGIFVLFVFFSYLVAREFFVQFDFDTTVRLQDNIPRRFDDFFSFFSDIGSFEPSVLILLIILALFVRKIRAAFVVLFFAAFHFIEIYGKQFVDQLPPPEFMLRTKKIIEFPQFHIREEFSYPSGHAGRAAFICVLLFFLALKSKKLSRFQKMFIIAAIVVYDAIMFTSRVYLGEHWISDIIGGVLLGAALGILSFAVL